jgi:hypothetical protein
VYIVNSENRDTELSVESDPYVLLWFDRLGFCKVAGSLLTGIISQFEGESTNWFVKEVWVRIIALKYGHSIKSVLSRVVSRYVSVLQFTKL